MYVRMVTKAGWILEELAAFSGVIGPSKTSGGARAVEIETRVRDIFADPRLEPKTLRPVAACGHSLQHLAAAGHSKTHNVWLRPQGAAAKPE